MILRVGLTGGIGSGKTTIAKIFEVLNVPVAYADLEARRLMNEDSGLRQDIINHFGEEAYAGGNLNRSWLASQVFNNPPKLELLNSLVHPVTIRAGHEWMQSLPPHTPYAIREAALIFESHTQAHLDFIIGVYAPATVRIHRTMQRDKTTREAVVQRMQNQIDEEIKIRLCDAVIHNDDQHAVLPQVLALHRELIQRARS